MKLLSNDKPLDQGSVGLPGAPAFNPIPTPPIPAHTPAVDQAVANTVHPTAVGAPQINTNSTSAVIDNTMRSGMSQPEKNEYVATLTQVAGAQGPVNDPRFGAPISNDEVHNLRNSMERLGTNNQDAAPFVTPGTVRQVQDSIAANVDNGRTNANDLAALVDPARDTVGGGMRNLISSVRDGNVLAQVSDKLRISAEQKIDTAGLGNGDGVNQPQYDAGARSMVAAADVATMASQRGVTRAANDVSLSIASRAGGPPNGEETATFPWEDDTPPTPLIEQMLGSGEPANGYFMDVAQPRNPTDTLSSLINSTGTRIPGQSKAIDNANDLIFSVVTGSGHDDRPGGLEQENRTAALTNLSNYVSKNIARLGVEAYTSDAGSDLRDKAMIKDFVQNIVSDPQYASVDQSVRDRTGGAIANQLDGLARTIFDSAAPDVVRQDAASQFGAITGSIRTGAEDAVTQGDNEAKASIDNIRNFTDIVTDQLAAKVPGGDLVGEVVTAGVDQAWKGIQSAATPDYAEAAESGTEGIAQLSASLRGQIGDAENPDGSRDIGTQTLTNDIDQRISDFTLNKLEPAEDN